MKDTLRENLKKLQKLNLKKYSPDFLATWDKSDSEIETTLLTTQILKDLYYSGNSIQAFETGLAISVFHDKSTRTRYSFNSGCDLLGLKVDELDETKSQIVHGETIMETVNMLSFLTRAFGIRDDVFLGIGHKYMQEVAKAASWGHREGILKYRPSVINLQSDEDHPTQSISDLSHLIDYFGGIERLKGKKITISWAYSPSYGKPLSVPQGSITLLTRFGMDVTLAYPKGYNLIGRLEKMSGKFAEKSGGSFKIVHNMDAAFKNADIVYPKSWASYSIMKTRTKLLKKGDEKGLKDLEKEALSQNAQFKDWECTRRLMKTTREGKALYMHCLPADITGVNCEEGEVEKGVFDKYKKETYREASYKPFAIAAMILLGQFGPQKSIEFLESRIG